MNNAQTINDLIMKCAELKKDAEYLAGERDYWKQQAQRNESVSGECDTESGVTLRDLFGIWKDTSDQLEADSREKLEEDVREFANVYYADHLLVHDKVMEFLDRQAAITTQECTDVYESGCEACRRAQKREISELQDKVDELEAEKTRAECQKYSDNSADWEDSCDTREILEHDCKWMAHAWAPDDFPDDKLEKKLYREIIEKLDRQAEITRADDERICETCRDEQVEALQEQVDELEAELDATRRTCSLEYDGKWLVCSNCGESLQWFGVRTVYKGDTQERALGVDGVRFCPFCGTRIEDGESE